MSPPVTTMMKIHHLSIDNGSDEPLERFIDLRRRIYQYDYAAYPETDSHRALIHYYASRPDYRIELLLGEEDGQGDVARILVGRSDAYPFAFFGFFECWNHYDSFLALIEKACELARRMGADELLGPIELNAIHGWMFLDQSSSAQRWIGDPHHLDYYPELFRRARWRVADQAVSGKVLPGAQRALLDERSAVLEAAARRGIEIRFLDQVPREKILADLWQVGRESFTPELNRAVPIEPAMLSRQLAPVLDQLRDPRSLVLLYDGEECAGYSLSIENFIDRLANPDGQKTPPANACGPSLFAIKSIAIRPSYQRQGLYKVLLTTCAAHSEERYRHPLAWRRTRIDNPGMRFLSTNADLTESYVTFRRAL